MPARFSGGRALSCAGAASTFTGSRLRTGGIDYLFIQAVTSISNSTTYGRLPVNRIIGAKADSAGPQGKPEVGWLEVDEESAGQRLDNFLIRHLKGVPKTHVYRIIRSGEVRVNKGRAAADTRVAAGDVVRAPQLLDNAEAHARMPAFWSWCTGSTAKPAVYCSSPRSAAP